MADYDIKLNMNQLVDVLNKNDAIKGLLESGLNQVLESQMTQYLGAEPHEQTEERTGYRNGTRVRELYTRVGPLNLRLTLCGRHKLGWLGSSTTIGASFISVARL